MLTSSFIVWWSQSRWKQAIHLTVVCNECEKSNTNNHHCVLLCLLFIDKNVTFLCILCQPNIVLSRKFLCHVFFSNLNIYFYKKILVPVQRIKGLQSFSIHVFYCGMFFSHTFDQKGLNNPQFNYVMQVGLCWTQRTKT